jgi:hypothetical protein
MTIKKNETIIHYFERAGSSDQFVRVFADLIHLAPHLLTVKIKGETYVYPCAYDLRKLLFGDILAVFAYPTVKSSSRAILYPLPQTAVFSEACIHTTFLPSETFSVLSDPRYIAVETEFQESRQKIKDKLHIFQIIDHNTVAFAEELPPPKEYRLKCTKNPSEGDQTFPKRSIHQRRYITRLSGKKKKGREQLPLVQRLQSKREAKKLEENRQKYLI